MPRNSKAKPPDTFIGSGRALPPLRLTPKLAYAAGALLDGVVTQAINIFLLFYATAVCGLPAALAGFALAVGLVVDAVVDPLIGSSSDGWQSRHGRRLPFIALGAPGTIVFLALIFSMPRDWSVPAMFVWLALCFICLRVSMSLYLLPYHAVGAELSDGYDERSSIAAWRWVFAMIGAIATICLGFGVFFSGPNGLSQRSAYFPFTLSLGLIVAAGAMMAMRSLASMADRQHAPSRREGPFGRRVLRDLEELFRNRSFRTLFFGTLLLFTASTIYLTLGIHANVYFWGMKPAQVQAVTLSLFVGLLCGAPLAGPLLRRMEKRTVLIVGIVGLALALSMPPTLRLLGLLSAMAKPPVEALAGVIFVGGMMMATAAIAFASMMADAADEHEYLFGARREGLYFAGWAFASKAATGIGSLIAGVALQLIGFPRASVAQFQAGPANLLPEWVRWLGLVYGPGSGLLAIAAAVVCFSYRLDGSRHRVILDGLMLRRRVAAGEQATAAID